MRESYRIRGRVARIAMNINLKDTTIIALVVIAREGSPGSRNSIIDKVESTRIDKYSDIKIKANFPPMYSILNPDTNSDSPSAISNGVRLASAKQVANQIITKGGISIRIRNPEDEMCEKSKDLNGIKATTKISAILIS